MTNIDPGKFFQSQTGSRGGIVRGGTKATANPPPELARQAEAENVAASRRAALEGSRIENPVVAHNREQQERDNFDEYAAQWIGTDWVERQPADGAEPLYFRIESFHWAIRPSVSGLVNGSQRDQFFLRVCATPWLPVGGLTPAQRKVAHGKRANPMFAVPDAAVNQTVREEFPCALLTLSTLLKTFKPVSDFDISPLWEMAKPDDGFEDVRPAEVPAQPTLADLITALTNALKPTPAKI